MSTLIIAGISLIVLAVVLFLMVAIKGFSNVRDSQRQVFGRAFGHLDPEVMDQFMARHVVLAKLGALAAFLLAVGILCIATHFILKAA